MEDPEFRKMEEHHVRLRQMESHKKRKLPESCLRITLLINSILIWVAGAALVLLGVFVFNFLKHFYLYGKGVERAGGFPAASIVIGIILMVFTFVANYFLIYPTKNRYFGITGWLMLMFFVEIIYFAVGVDYGDTVPKFFKDNFKTAVINYGDGFIFDVELNTLQAFLKCCGFEDFKDWYHTTWADGKMQVPESCCIDPKKCHNLVPVMIDDIYREGCDEKLEGAVNNHKMFLFAVVGLSLVNELLGIAVSLLLGIREMRKPIPHPERIQRANQRIERASSEPILQQNRTALDPSVNEKH